MQSVDTLRAIFSAVLPSLSAFPVVSSTTSSGIVVTITSQGTITLAEYPTQDY